MEQNQPGPTLDESVKQVMQTLPSVIRAYLAQGKYTAVAKNLMRTYNLRIDQGGILEREIMLLLMGIDSPDEFTKALVEEAKLDQNTVNSITQDVNTQIFVPLREELRRPAGSESRPQASGMRKGPAPVPQPQKFAAAMPPRPTPPASNFNLQNKIPPPARPQGAPGQRSDLRNVLASVTGEKLLEDHEEPHIEFHKAQQPIPPRTFTAPNSWGQRTVPPANLPGAMPPSRPIAPRIATPPAPMRPPYSSDPYREPVDEK